MDNHNYNTDSEMINAIKGSIKSPHIWNKLVKTIQNSNIDVDKLIEDSIEYGLDVGLFQQSRNGKVVPLDVKSLSPTVGDQTVNPTKNKSDKQTYSSNLKSRPLSQSESESFKCSNTFEFSNAIKTRRSDCKKDQKRTQKMPQHTKKIKRKKYEKGSPGITELKSIKGLTDFGQKNVKVRTHNREMARAVPICAYCLGDELLNKRTRLQEDMIVCWDCGTCAHPSCLRWPPSLLEKVRNIRWQCLQCKCCSYCGNISKKDDDMLLCDACDQGFHMYCFNPPMKTPPKGEWICRLCRPSIHHRETTTFFSDEDFNFYPNCQIVTSENVYILSNTRKKSPNPSKTLKIKKYLIKSRAKISGKRDAKVNLLHMKKKKILEKAVQRQKLALTDGLSMFFTPGNKRTSRVSKQSLTSNSLNNLSEPKTPTSPVKERNSVRSFGSRAQSKSPIMLEKVESLKKKGESVKQIKEEMSTKIKIPEALDYEASLVSKESSPSIPSEPRKKRGGRPRKQVTMELKTGSVADASTTESSSVTMSRIDQGTNHSAMSNDNAETDPYPISDLDRQWYAEIQEKVAQLLPPPMDVPPHLHSLNKTSRHRAEHADPPELSMEGINSKDTSHEHNTPSGDSIAHAVNKKFPPRIQIGKYIIDTWYSAPYPSEYARLNVLYICEYCLKHIKSYDVYIMHMEKCTQHFPPGNEIYRNGDLSVFEVDGYVSKLYCQQLCLLAKLFLDHKTLYYDVEPFLFYVAVLSQNQSCHIIGYFSKEKRSTHKYNLSCIMVLPPYQKFNYGRFLIDFSYLLSRNEGQSGSPEKPLSTLGRLSYESYWKSKVIPYLMNREDVSEDFYRHIRFSKPPKGLSITIDRISTETGINPHDVASTIQILSKTVDLDESDRITIQLDWDRIKSESEKYATRYSNWIPLDVDCLRWAPLRKSNDTVVNTINLPVTTSSPVSQSSPLKKKEETTKPSNKPKTLKTSTASVKRSHQSSKPKTNKERSVDTESVIVPHSPQRNTPNKTNENLDKTVDRKDGRISPFKLKSSPKLKREVNERTIVTRNKGVRQLSLDDMNIITRNISTIMKQCTPNTTKDASINVDLTGSDNSDNQDNDDCVITFPISTRLSDLRKTKPVLEMFKDTLIAMDDLENSTSKPSPSININEPSPVSSSHNAIICPTLVSPEIDLEEETEAELILSNARRPFIILEKCDENPNAFTTIDLSDDIISEQDLIADQIDNPFSREMNIVVSNSNSKSSTPENISSNDESQASTLGNIEFVLPSCCVKDAQNNDENAPTLSRVSSQDSNSGHHDDSSNSLKLPSDISLNEEFKRFYNDGNVFNSIATSHTDSSDRDADESLLSVSNSDVEINGTYSCDSSICYNAKNTVLESTKLDEEQLEDHYRCSPGQSDLVLSQVSSTTPFITPSTVWNASIKNLVVGNVNDVDQTKIVSPKSQRCNETKSGTIDGAEDLLVKDGDSDAVMLVEKDVVSSSLGRDSDEDGDGDVASCQRDQQIVVSSMEAPKTL